MTEVPSCTLRAHAPSRTPSLHCRLSRKSRPPLMRASAAEMVWSASSRAIRASAVFSVLGSCPRCCPQPPVVSSCWSNIHRPPPFPASPSAPAGGLPACTACIDAVSLVVAIPSPFEPRHHSSTRRDRAGGGLVALGPLDRQLSFEVGD